MAKQSGKRVNIHSGRNWLGLGVGVPLTQIKHASVGAQIDIALRDDRIRTKRHSRSFVARTRAVGFQDANRFIGDHSKQLAPGFLRPTKALPMARKMGSRSRGNQQFLSKIVVFENKLGSCRSLY
nr:hypothetical protein [Caballeronia sp. GAFFF2]